MNRYFESLKITKEAGNYCLGDIENNETVKALSLLPDSKRVKLLSDFISGYMKDLKDNWIPRRFTKREIAALCALVESKTEKTFEKRALSYIHSLLKGSIYNAMLNKSKIDLFIRVFGIIL